MTVPPDLEVEPESASRTEVLKLFVKSLHRRDDVATVAFAKDILQTKRACLFLRTPPVSAYE